MPRVIPDERVFWEFRKITIENHEIVGTSRIFSASGLAEKPIVNVNWANVTAEGRDAGFIEYARDWKMKNVRLRTQDGASVKVANSERMNTREVVRKASGQ